MANSITKNTLQGWRILIDTNGFFTLQKAVNVGGSYSAVTFPANGKGTAGAITLEEARELAMELLQATN